MKVWFLIKFKKNFTARIATIKEAIKPTASKINSEEVYELKLLFEISRTDAAIIVGTASKKENSTAAFLLVPRNSAPIIVAADLETPGITEIDWKRPIKKEFLILISSMDPAWWSFS